MIKKQVPGLQIFNSDAGSDPDKRNYVVSNERILSTGFRMKYSLEDGIAELVAGYSAFRDFKFKNY